MDTSPVPAQRTRLLVEIVRTPANRLEGRVRADVNAPWRDYSGVLELLKVLEELLDAQSPPPNEPEPRETP
jgi:hypothetical protein